MLKDASAGAIYGRAAAGVILVTNNKAKEGKTQVNYSCELSIEKRAQAPRFPLSSQEYIERGLGQDYGYDTDWYKELTRDNPLSQRHVCAISGGTKDLQLYLSLMYSDDKA